MPAAKKQTKKAKITLKTDDHRVTLQIVRYLPPDLETHFADNTLVTHTENEFALSFMQSQFPLAANKEELEKVGEIVSKCVVRIIVTPKHMVQIVEAFQGSLAKYKETYQKAEVE